VNCM